MTRENISQEFRLKNIDETKTVAGCVSVTNFASLVGIY